MRIRVRVLAAAVAAAWASSAVGQGTNPATLSQLRATHAHSTPEPIAMSRDAATVFAAEAGVLAVIDPVVSMTTPIKVESISSHGVRAVEMALDPDADLSENPKSENLLYIAAGRMGLWVVQADPRPGVSLAAARIDDAVSPGNQSSARWANDVDFMTMGGTTYLLALFASKDDTRLRAYPLSSARSVLTANPGVETGHEIWRTLEVVLDENGAWPTPTAQSFGFGMAVDGEVVYVALGMQGVVPMVTYSRVRP